MSVRAFVAAGALALLGCAAVPGVGLVAQDSVAQAPVEREPAADRAETARTEWRELAPLPDPIGFAGAFVGVTAAAGDTASGGALLLAGGANFAPPVFDNDKRWHDRVFVLAEPDGAWQEVGRLAAPRAYGASVSWDGEVVCVGGDDAERAHADVFALRFDGGSLLRRELPALPEPLAYHAAALVGDRLFVVGGQRGKSIRDATAGGYVLDLAAERDAPEAAAWTPLPEIPGGPRAFCYLQLQQDGRGEQLFLFGGRRFGQGFPFDLECLRDTWRLDPRRLEWAPRASSPRPLMAGAATPLGQSCLVVWSHADGSRLGKLAAFEGAPRDFDHPGFPRELPLYHTITDTWSTLGAIPAQAANQVTTTAVQWRGAVVVPSGEVEPRIRTPQVFEVHVPQRLSRFGALDLTVLVLYLLAMVGIGLGLARRNRSADDYFRGGGRVPFWAAACSIYATMLSSLTYVALPALVFATDWLLYPGMFMILAAAPIATMVAMPFYRRIDATSAYQLFGERFGMPVRWLASGLFTLFHISRMGIVMALTALAMSAVTGLSPATSVAIMGVLCLIYCTLGGITAVIWTDTIQTVVLLGGVLVCLGYLWIGLGDRDVGALIDEAAAAGKLRLFDLDFSRDSFTKLSVWVILLGGLGQNMSSYTADQAVVQRYVSTPDTRSAARSIWLNGLMAVPGSMLFFLLGTGLWLFYRAFPERLDPGLQNDQILPAFLGAELPAGLAGLIVAGIFAAAQSTVSTSMNSTATALVTDFFGPLGRIRDGAHELRLAKRLTLLMGVLGTAAGLLFISDAIRSLMAEYFKVIGMFMGALGGLFLLAVTSGGRKLPGQAALIGLLAGVAAMVVAWQFTATEGYLFAVIGILVCFVVGRGTAELLLLAAPRDTSGPGASADGEGRAVGEAR